MKRIWKVGKVTVLKTSGIKGVKRGYFEFERQPHYIVKAGRQTIMKSSTKTDALKIAKGFAKIKEYRK